MRKRWYVEIGSMVVGAATVAAAAFGTRRLYNKYKDLKEEIDAIPYEFNFRNQHGKKEKEKNGKS